RSRTHRPLRQTRRGSRRRANDRLRDRRDPPAQGTTRRPCTDESGRAAARFPSTGRHRPHVTRWRLTIEYDGGPFMGWQRQEHGPSVQQTLEEAIHRMTGELASVHAAGRTDAGVHALAMAAHVEIEKGLTEHRFREGLNALVRPAPISVLGVERVADDWHG